MSLISNDHGRVRHVREPNWLAVLGLVVCHRLYIVHSAITTGRPESVAEGTSAVAQHQYETQGSLHRALPKIWTEFGRRRLCYGGVQEYNRLPIIKNPRAFRYRLRRHLLRVQHGG